MTFLWRRHSLGIQARLVILVLVTVLPLVALASLAIFRAVADERGWIERDVRERTQTLLAAVDRLITSVQAELQILAMSAELRTGDLAGFYPRMRDALTIRGLSIVLHDTDAQQLISTNRPYGEKLPRQNQRAMLDRVAETGKPQISDLIMGAVLRRPILTIGVPVFRDGKVVYVLSMAVAPQSLSDLLGEQNVSPDWTIGVFDRKGVIVARNREIERFLGQPASPILRERMAEGVVTGSFRNVTSEGLDVHTAFVRSPLSGWTVAIGAPQELIDAPLRRAQALAVGGGTAGLALSLALAWWLARAIRGPVEALRQAAGAVGDHAPPTEAITGVREVEQIAEALQASGRALQERARQRDLAERALRDSEERFRTLADSLPQLVWTCLSDGRPDYLSRQWFAYTGMPAAEPGDSGWLERVLHPEDRPRLAQSWNAAREARGDFDVEHRILAADGRYRWFKTRATPIRDEADHAVKWFGTCTDIEDIVAARETLTRSAEQLEAMVAARTGELAITNQRLNAEIEARERAQAALVQAQKMEAIGQLTGGIAHDFNNLLTVIIGNLDALQRGLPATETRMQNFAAAAQRGADRAAILTHRLLAFARRQPLMPRSIEINRLISGMSDMLHRTLGENIAIETVLSAGLWRIRADPNELENALLNLVLNARDAMLGEGKLTIETANAHLDEAYAAAHDEVEPGQYAVLAVTDTGTGMTPEVRATAFEPFFTTKKVGEGSGLGLSMVYGFVKQSGGHVKIYSEVGQGTTIRLYFPRLVASGEELPAEAAPRQLPRAERRETILVVEDDPDVRAYSAGTLAELGYEVVTAGDAGEALALLHARRVDLLFADVGLPGINGRQVADEARLLDPAIRVLFTTGYAQNAIVHNGILDSGVELITKPFSIEALARRIRQILDSRRAPAVDPAGSRERSAAVEQTVAR
jgi:PAS domain S-box-containing protein